MRDAARIATGDDSPNASWRLVRFHDAFYAGVSSAAFIFGTSIGKLLEENLTLKKELEEANRAISNALK